MVPAAVINCWPPQDGEAERLAQKAMQQVFESMDAIEFAEIMRKKLVVEYIRQVNFETYSSKMLKDQMQALVLAMAELLVDKMSEEAYVALKNAYEDPVSHKAVRIL